MILIGLIGLLLTALTLWAAIRGAMFARNAWLRPVPDLVLTVRTKKLQKKSDGKWSIELHINAHNASTVSAFIDEIYINKIPASSLAAKGPQNTENCIHGTDLLPKFIIRPDNGGWFKAVVLIGKKRPRRILVVIVTPKRTFKRKLTPLTS